MRKLLTIIILLTVMMIPTFVQAQGCMGGGDEEGVSVMGFIQTQYENKQKTDESTFTFNRARLGVVGNIPYDISYYMFVEYSPFKNNSPYLLDAFITYSRLNPFMNISMGQFKSPFSMERNTGCSGLHTVNRSLVVEELAMDRDIGILMYGDYKKMLSYKFGIMNGAGRGMKDDNKAKDYIGRLVLSPISGLKVGGGFSLGKRVPSQVDAEDDERNRYSAELEYKWNNLLVQGEYIYGEDIGSYTTGGGCGGEPVVVHQGTMKRSGYFFQTLYMTPWNIQPVFKYEVYDTDLDLDDNTQNVMTFGFNYFLNEWTRIQANYLYCAEPGNEIENDQILIQLQALIR